MWPLAQIEAQKQLQDRSLLFWTLILPIAFIVGFMEIFGDSFGNREAVANQVITGYSVFFSVFIIISMTISFLKDRENGLVARLASTPLQSWQYFVGKWLPFVAIVFGQMLVLLLVGVVVYGVTIDQPFLYLLTILGLSIMVTSLGVVIAVFSKTENFGILMTQIIAMGGAILGGLWIPFEQLPGFIQIIGKFTPQYWPHQALLSSVSADFNGESIALSLLILLGYTLLWFIIALIGYKKFLRGSKN